MDKQLLYHIYNAKVEELKKRRIPEIEEGCKEEVLIDLVQQNTKYLPIWVVLARELDNPMGTPKAFYYIGALGCDHRIFFKDTHFYLGTVGIIAKEGPPVYIVSRVKTAKEIGRDAIIQDLEYASAKNQPNPKPVVPKGYFLFKFTAQWAAGGNESNPVEKMFVCQADALENAIKILLRYLENLHETAFSKFFICFDNTGWKISKPKNTFWDDSIHRQELYTPNIGKITMKVETKISKENDNESEDKR